MTGIELIAAERARQVTEEGWTPEHDNGHDDGALALAAACYVLPHDRRTMEVDTEWIGGWAGPGPKRVVKPRDWPWKPEWWKPTPDDRVRELAKAGALIAAEIDRLKRGTQRWLVLGHVELRDGQQTFIQSGEDGGPVPIADDIPAVPESELGTLRRAWVQEHTSLVVELVPIVTESSDELERRWIEATT